VKNHERRPRWEWEQEESAGAKRTKVTADLKRLQLQLSPAEAAARLQVVHTEMEARSAEMAVLADATGSASKLLKTDRAVLCRMRHADADIRIATRTGASKNGTRKNLGAGSV
jgi:hypothetical protein